MGQKGTPLTEEQLTTLAQMWVESGGNASAVARELDVSVSTVTRALARLGKQTRAKLQSESLRAGLLTGQAYLEAAIEVVGDILVSQKTDGPGVDGGDAAKLLSALSRASSTVAALDRREEQRRQAQLTRKKTRAEIALLKARVDEIPPLDVLRAKLSPSQIVELVRGLTEEQLTAATALTEPKEEIPAKDG